jgi:hypothetical protein
MRNYQVDICFAVNSSGQRDSLLLPAGEVDPLFADFRRVS